MVYDCISQKLSEFKETKRSSAKGAAAQVNDLKLKIKEIEISEKQLVDTILSGALNVDLLELANQKASRLKRDKMSLYERMEEMKYDNNDAETVVNLAQSWKNADYSRKKEVAMIMIRSIMISENGDTKIIWNI